MHENADTYYMNSFLSAWFRSVKIGKCARRSVLWEDISSIRIHTVFSLESVVVVVVVIIVFAIFRFAAVDLL